MFTILILVSYIVSTFPQMFVELSITKITCDMSVQDA